MRGVAHALALGLALALSATTAAAAPGETAATASAPSEIETPAGFDSADTARYHFEWAPGLAGYARSLMARVEDHHDRIYAELGVDGVRPTTVVILPDQDAMLDEARRRFGAPPPEWAAGLAWPAYRTILLHVGVGPEQLDMTFRHEISHIAFGEVGSGRSAPRWFTEGLAIRQSEGVDLQRAWTLTEAATIGVLLELDALDRGFPKSGARAGVAYAQAVHFVGYLQGTYGDAAFRHLIAELRAGRDFREAVQAAFDAPLPAIEAEWLKGLKVRWGWLPVLFGSTTLWAVATVMLVLAWRRRKRQRARRLAELAAREEAAMATDITVVAKAAPPPSRPPPRAIHDPYDGRPPTIH
ncbi:MAG: peptidase MA family metallohydrolase [bacterium]